MLILLAIILFIIIEAICFLLLYINESLQFRLQNSKSNKDPLSYAIMYTGNSDIGNKIVYTNDSFVFYSRIEDKIYTNELKNTVYDCGLLLHEVIHERQANNKYLPIELFFSNRKYAFVCFFTSILTIIAYLLTNNIIVLYIFSVSYTLVVLYKSMELIFEADASIKATKFLSKYEDTSILKFDLFVCWFTYFTEFIEYILLIPILITGLKLCINLKSLKPLFNAGIGYSTYKI